MATIASLTVVTRAKTAQFDRAMRKSGKRVHGLRKDLRRLAMGAGLYLGGRQIARFVGGAVREFASFEKQMALVHTMLDEGTAGHLPKYTKAVTRLSMAYGQATEVLSRGLYDILSAGIATADAIDVLEVATKAAIAGATDTATAIRPIVALLNAYQLGADKAAWVSDILFGTVKKGVLTFPDLADNIGKTVSLARAAGMSMSDMAAALAAMTKQGASAEMATTRLNAILKALPKAGPNLLREMTKFAGMSLEQIQALGVANIRAAAGIATLSGDIEGLAEIMRFLGDATGEMEVAFAKMADTTSLKIARLEQQWKAFWRGLGRGIVHVLVEFDKAGAAGEALLRKTVPPAALRLALTEYQPSLPPIPSAVAAPFAMAEPPRMPAWIAQSEAFWVRRVKEEREYRAIQDRLAKERLARDRIIEHEVRLLKIEGIKDSYYREIALIQATYNERIRLAKEVENVSGRELALLKEAMQIELMRAKLQREVARMKPLVDFANQIKEAMKTPIEVFKEFRKRIEEAVRAGLLTQELASRALQERMRSLMEGGGAGELRMVRTRFIDPRGLQQLNPQVKEQRQTNRILNEQLLVARKQLEKLGVPS